MADHEKVLNEGYEKQLTTRYRASQPSLYPILLLADHGIADTEYSLKHKTYTFSQTIAASEGQLHDLASFKTKCIDVAVDRYWPALDNIESQKIARGSKNFLSENALEPQRLMQALELGGEIANDPHDDHIIYLCDAGAGNDITCETIVSQLCGIKEAFSTLAEASYINFKSALSKIEVDNSHPFNYLEKFGGYETAVALGVITHALKRNISIIIEGWSCIAAWALACKLRLPNSENVLFSALPGSHILESLFLKEDHVQPIHKQAMTEDGGQFLGKTVAIVQQLFQES